jgi:hypothetical protein
MMEISDQHAIPPMPVHSVDGPMLLVYVYGMAAFTGALFLWWWIFTVIFIFDCVAISIAVFMDLLGFYGNQPFNLWGYPLWWAAIDSPQPLIAGLMMYWFLPRLQHTRTKLLFVFLVPPISMGAITGAAIFPVALALNTAQSGLLSYVGGGATLALGTFVAWICITLMNAQESHKPT